jgi:hypothetical protein
MRLEKFTVTVTLVTLKRFPSSSPRLSIREQTSRTSDDTVADIGSRCMPTSTEHRGPNRLIVWMGSIALSDLGSVGSTRASGYPARASAEAIGMSFVALRDLTLDIESCGNLHQPFILSGCKGPEITSLAAATNNLAAPSLA